MTRLALDPEGFNRERRMFCYVVQLAHQPPGVIHRVILDPGKMLQAENGEWIIRIGDYPGDEVCGWQYLSNITIVTCLGTAVFDREHNRVDVTPLPEQKAA